MLQIGENCIGDAWNVGAGVREGNREQKMFNEWFKHSHEGKETTEDELRSGQSSTIRSPEMIEKVRQMLALDRRLTLSLIAEELGISKDTAHTIVRGDLGKRKLCSRFVPHKLTDEQKAKQMETSGDFISIVSRKHRHGRWDLVLLVPSRIKTTIDGVVFTDFPATKESSAKIQGKNAVDPLRVTAVLRSISQEAFAGCFRKLYERCQTCIVTAGHYFEGQ